MLSGESCLCRYMNKSNWLRQGIVQLVFITFACLVFAAGISAQQPTARRSLIISLDGLDTRYVSEPDKYGLKIPTLRKLMANGVTARGVFSVFPSVTYPNHTSLVTGANPSKHGIVGNGIFEPPDQKQTGSWYWYARDIKTDTLWQSAKRAGKTVGLVSWPVSVGAGDWNIPEIWVPGGNALQSRKRIAENAVPTGLLEEIEKKVPDLYRSFTADESDDTRTRVTEYILTEKRPDVTLVHLADLDHFEHEFGPFTPEALSMLEKADGYVARLLAALERAGTANETAVFITSDHGFKPISRQLNPGVLLRNAGLVESKTEKDEKGVGQVVTSWKAAAHANGASCAIYLKDPNDKETLKKLREIFEPLEGRADSGIHKVLDANEIKRTGSNPAAVLMLDPADGFTCGNNYFGEFNVASNSKGMHGYLPTRPDFFASFIASGAGVNRRGKIDYMQMSDAAATIAATLGLRLNDAIGKAADLSSKKAR